MIMLRLNIAGSACQGTCEKDAFSTRGRIESMYSGRTFEFSTWGEDVDESWYYIELDKVYDSINELPAKWCLTFLKGSMNIHIDVSTI